MMEIINKKSTDLRIDWQVLEYLMPVDQKDGFMLETDNNFFAYCEYYARDEAYNLFKKMGCARVEFFQTTRQSATPYFFVVGYKD